jgi:hypothetical protein
VVDHHDLAAALHAFDGTGHAGRAFARQRRRDEARDEQTCAESALIARWRGLAPTVIEPSVAPVVAFEHQQPAAGFQADVGTALPLGAITRPYGLRGTRQGDGAR